MHIIGSLGKKSLKDEVSVADKVLELKPGRDRDKVIKQIKQEARSGILTRMMGSTGEVESQKIRLDAEIREEEKLLKEFKVHPQYREIENEANQITGEIHELINMNISYYMSVYPLEITPLFLKIRLRVISAPERLKCKDRMPYWDYRWVFLN